MNSTAKILIIAGLVIVLLGLIWHFFGDKLHFIGNLPGDIRVERENFKFYFPFTTMIILSVLVNLIFRLIQKFF